MRQAIDELELDVLWHVWIRHEPASSERCPDDLPLLFMGEHVEAGNVRSSRRERRLDPQSRELLPRFARGENERLERLP